MGLYTGGLLIGRIFASEIWEAYFREGLFLGGGGGGGGGLLTEFYGILNILSMTTSYATQLEYFWLLKLWRWISR